MKRILITGCSSGFGFESAKHLAKNGHFVYASMRNVNGKNSKVASELLDFAKSNNCNIEILEIDVTSDSSVLSAVGKIPKLDVLINNAGVGYGGPVEAFSSQEILAQLDLNIVGPLRVVKAVLPMMRIRGSGLIIQVSSTAGRGVLPGFGIYHASKWGLEGVSEALRYELAPFGIDVVIVEPGPFATNFFENIVGGSDIEISQAYKHVGEFMEGFGNQVQQMIADDDAPTDPMIVVKTYEDLINMPVGSRPLRTIAGLDFGFQALNDAVEPIRLSGLKSMGIAGLDGPSA
ncbi:MAG: SDR family oxidoreductase [Bacteroidetes bacterium]|nr:SDR family oxidoreductase [Bacteroidota bacterium]